MLFYIFANIAVVFKDKCKKPYIVVFVNERSIQISEKIYGPPLKIRELIAFKPKD